MTIRGFPGVDAQDGFRTERQPVGDTQAIEVVTVHPIADERVRLHQMAKMKALAIGPAAVGVQVPDDPSLIDNGALQIGWKDFAIKLCATAAA